jgi:hypothetical protein
MRGNFYDVSFFTNSGGRMRVAGYAENHLRLCDYAADLIT